MSNKIRMFNCCISLVVLILPSVAAAAGAIEGEVVRQAINIKAIVLFLLFVAFTLCISYWASKRTRTSSQFYTAGGQITGLQNGAAIAGDFMSAASFLGITGLIFLVGMDGMVFAIGAFAGFPLLLMLLAERVRNLGKHTFTDVASLRLEERNIRIVSVLSSITIVVLYLIAQVVGAGKLIELLFGLPYEVAVLVVGFLVILYVTFGGMLATTWVQITKAILLLFGSTLIVLLILWQFNFSLESLFEQATKKHRFSEAVLAPGNLFKDPVQVLTILMAMVFGTMGLPHILMRFFTVANMQEARKSSLWASLFMGYFFLLMIVIGFGSIAILLQNPEFFGPDGKIIGGSNMVAIHLASAVGGDWLMGFISAVAFATILAVVAGLTVAGAAAVAHDLYAKVICKGAPDVKKELNLTRLTTVVLCLAAIGLGIVFQHQNIAFIATLPFVFAATINFPILLLSLYWSGLTTRGAVIGAIGGFILSLLLTITGPKVWVSILGFESPIFPYDYPALFTMPVAFFLIWVFSVTDRTERADLDRANYKRLLIQSEFGIRDA